MSLQAMAWAYEYQDLPMDDRTNRIMVSCKVVLIALANYAGPKGTDAFPSVQRIQYDTGLSERTIQGSLRALEDHGTIAKTPDPLVRASTIGRPDHRPQSYDLVAFARGAESTEPRVTTTSRGAKSGGTGCKLSNDFAPEPTTNLEPSNQTPEPSISSNEEMISPRARAHTRVGAGARETGTTRSGDDQLPLDGLPAPVEAVVPINRKAEETFARFWAVYPLKKAKGDAWKAWPKAIKAADPDVILAGVARYVAELRATGAYTAYPATWLNGQRWEDEAATVGNAARGGTDRRGGGHQPYRDTEDESMFAQSIN
jgi:hypothetical protein